LVCHPPVSSGLSLSFILYYFTGCLVGFVMSFSVSPTHFLRTPCPTSLEGASLEPPPPLFTLEVDSQENPFSPPCQGLFQATGCRFHTFRRFYEVFVFVFFSPSLTGPRSPICRTLLPLISALPCFWALHPFFMTFQYPSEASQIFFFFDQGFTSHRFPFASLVFMFPPCLTGR